MTQDNYHHAVQKNYDRLSRWYDFFSSSERRITRKGLSLLDLQPGERVLEIGCGTGHALVELAAFVGGNGWVEGIDLSTGMISIARRRANRTQKSGIVHLTVGNANKLPYSKHQFHAVIMCFTLELFTQIEIPLVLSESWQIIKPGGRLAVISLVKKDTLPVAIYEWFHERFPDVIDCRPIYLRALLENAGYIIGEIVDGMIWGLPVAAILAYKPLQPS